MLVLSLQQAMSSKETTVVSYDCTYGYERQRWYKWIQKVMMVMMAMQAMMVHNAMRRYEW